MHEGGDRRGGEQVAADAGGIRPRNEPQVVVADGGDDARGAVRRRRDDATARGVLFVHRQREGVQPLGRGVAEVLVAVVLLEASPHLGGAALHAESAGQGALGREPVLDALGHRRPDGVEAVVDALLAVHRDLVGTRDVAERDAVLVAQVEQLRGVRIGQRMSQRLGLLGRVALAADESAADRVVGLFSDRQGGIGAPCLQGQCVRMARQPRARLEAEVALGDHDRVGAGDAHLGAVVAEPVPGAAHVVGVAVVGTQPGESRDDRVGGAVAEAGRAEGAVQRARDARHRREHAVGGESLGERTRRPHRTDRVRTRGTDPDREEIEG